MLKGLSFDIRYSDTRFSEVSFSIKLVASAASSQADR
jgi:hypothetical protein